jgi:hypothetical protein
MIFVLGFVNTKLANSRIDKRFQTIEALLKYVEEEGFEWNSLVIGIIKDANAETSEQVQIRE